MAPRDTASPFHMRMLMPLIGHAVVCNQSLKACCLQQSDENVYIAMMNQTVLCMVEIWPNMSNHLPVT